MRSPTVKHVLGNSTHRFIRTVAVWIIAWAFRRGITPAQAMEALAASYRCECHGSAWRLGVVEDAQARNAAKMARA